MPEAMHALIQLFHCKFREFRGLTCFPRDQLFIIKNEDTTILSLLSFSPEA